MCDFTEGELKRGAPSVAADGLVRLIAEGRLAYKIEFWQLVTTEGHGLVTTFIVEAWSTWIFQVAA